MDTLQFTVAGDLGQCPDMHLSAKSDRGSQRCESVNGQSSPLHDTRVVVQSEYCNNQTGLLPCVYIYNPHTPHPHYTHTHTQSSANKPRQLGEVGDQAIRIDSKIF